MDREVSEIVSDLLSSYQEVGGINRIDCSNLPSKPAIGAVCDDLLRLAFPGFLDTEAIASEELENETALRVSKVITALEKEVIRSLRFVSGEGSVSEDRAQELVCSFLRQLPGIRRVLRTDVEAAYDGDPAAKSFDEIILAYPCLEAIAIQRMARILYQEGVPLIPRMMTEWAHSKTGIDIHPGAKIGSHFFIDHGTGVVVGETCEIGHHVKLYHGVTLGARSFPKDGEGNPIKGIKRHPKVEDGVTIYPGATILGGETTIGARSTIGASAFIMRSIEPDSLVALPEVAHDIKDKSAHRRITEEKKDH
jgi:serine O-acetyltransferase